MFIFGHLGIGLKVVQPWNKGLSRGFILFGALLPDLIDKPLFYGLKWAGGSLALISGTRTFGHTLAFLLVLSLVSFFSKSKPLAAVSLGVASHLLLDSLSDRILSGNVTTALDFKYALFFPLLGFQFPAYPYSGMKDHLSAFTQPLLVGAEFLGLFFLFWELYKMAYFRESLTRMNFIRLGIFRAYRTKRPK